VGDFAIRFDSRETSTRRRGSVEDVGDGVDGGDGGGGVAGEDGVAPVCRLARDDEVSMDGARERGERSERSTHRDATEGVGIVDDRADGGDGEARG